MLLVHVACMIFDYTSYTLKPIMPASPVRRGIKYAAKGREWVEGLRSSCFKAPGMQEREHGSACALALHSRQERICVGAVGNYVLGKSFTS